MNPSLENPFRPTAKRAKKRLFQAGDKQNNFVTKATKEKLEKAKEFTKVKYGPYNILYPQAQFLKEIEKLIPEGVLDETGKTAKEILIDRIKEVDNKGNILELDLNYLRLDSLPDLPSYLRKFSCHANHLSNLPKLPPSLQTLECHNNQLSSLPELPSVLQKLVCVNNQLSRLPKLPATLQELSCYNNQLSSLPKLPVALQKLDCMNNQLSSLPELPAALQKLHCGRNQLSSLPELPSSLQELHCYNNHLSSLPELPASLQRLVCHNNLLTEEAIKIIKAHKNYSRLNFSF